MLSYFSMAVALLIFELIYFFLTLRYLSYKTPKFDKLLEKVFIDITSRDIIMYKFLFSSLIIPPLLLFSDIVYSAICMNLNLACPSEGVTDWSEFSYSYVGLILMVLMGWSFFLTKLGKILELTSKGILSVIFGATFCLYLAYLSFSEGKVNIET